MHSCDQRRTLWKQSIKFWLCDLVDAHTLDHEYLYSAINLWKFMSIAASNKALRQKAVRRYQSLKILLQ